MIQKKLHPAKTLGVPCKTTKGKIGPAAVLLHIYVRLWRIIVRQSFHYDEQDFSES